MEYCLLTNKNFVILRIKTKKKALPVMNDSNSNNNNDLELTCAFELKVYYTYLSTQINYIVMFITVVL